MEYNFREIEKAITPYPSKTSILIQWILFLFINCTFLFKYSQRISFSPYLATTLYIIFVVFLYNLVKKMTRLNYKYATATLFVCVCALISIILVRINPLSINVDRWSATTYFLDGLFSRVYPYGIHTHVSEHNFPSPFPLWHYLNLPFWLLKDVGIGLFVFLSLVVYTVFKFTTSYKKTFFFLLLLSVSPAYWWEVTVRSDGLSNQILIFCCILYMHQKKISFNTKWIQTSILVGLCACTRLSALIAIGIYLFRSYIKIPLSRQIYAVLIIGSILLIFFIPYIFWDTDTWIFFTRNPFMSQSTPANIWVLSIVTITSIVFTMRNNPTNIINYFSFISLIMFLFFLGTLICFHIQSGNGSVWDDANFDISYLTLSLPYCLTTLINKK